MRCRNARSTAGPRAGNGIESPGAAGEDGVALVVASMGMLLLMALGAALVLTTSSETMVAANFRSGRQAFYAADAVLERAISELRGVSDWNLVLSGGERSSFADGPPSGVRRLDDGSTVDLEQIVNLANCRQFSPCSDATLNEATIERPWGSNNPRWRLYAYGRLSDALLPLQIESRFYVVALVADDPSETDGNPGRDGDSVSGRPNPGRGVIMVRGEAFGPGGGQRAIEATVARIDTPEPPGGPLLAPALRVLSWREVR